MEGVRLNIRVILMLVLTLALSVVMGGHMFNMQIVNGEAYEASSEKSIASSFTVSASRGEILDRYGRRLVGNRMSMRVVIDESKLKASDDPAGTLSALITAARAAGSVVNDTMPVGGPPYEYHDPMSSSQKSQLERFFEKKEIDPAIEARELMTLLREEYGLPDNMEETQARRVIGVFYELECRTLFTTVKPYSYIAPYVFTDEVGIDLIAVIKEHGWAGITVETVSVREITTDFAAHILGRVGQIPAGDADYYTSLGYSIDDTVGVDGAEKAFESWLRGTPGVQAVESNTSGKIMNVLYSKEPEPGKNVYLTIDIRLQEMTERILAEGIKTLQETGEPLKGKEAEAGAIVVMDVKTSEVLAMATYPTYDLKSFYEIYGDLLEDPFKPLMNRAISGQYAPGSTFKMVTTAAAMETGVAAPNTKILDRGKYTYWDDYQPQCHIYPGSHGSVNAPEALRVSCNYYFYEVGRLAGIHALVDWAHRFGLGVSTGIELSGESKGYAAGPDTAAALGTFWYPGNILSASIGQSDNRFTPLQICNYVCTIANGGTLNAAHLLREVKSADYSETVYINAGEKLADTGMKDSTVQALQTGMRMVAQSGGTAYSVFGNYPVSVAAKTGSVQIGDQPNNGVFVAYAPYEEPEIAVCVVIEKGGAGSRVAPMAKDVFDAWLALKDDMNTISDWNVLQK